ncbi:hypothetical protein D3C87_1637060 [compost metagenome]
MQQILTDLAADIQSDRTLPAIGAKEVRRLFRRRAILTSKERRAPSSRVIAGAGTLNLHHVSAQVGQ